MNITDYIIVLAWLFIICLFGEINHNRTTKKLREIELRQKEILLKLDSVCV